MREIKFRAWVTTTMEMYDWDDLTGQAFWWDDRHYILMQFTGLKDKTGRRFMRGISYRYAKPVFTR